MAQSQNTKVDLAIKATSLSGVGTYGDVMIGDVAFEFYNERNPEDYIQIPWTEIDYVAAEVLGKRTIPRFAIFIKGGAHFNFSTRYNRKTLRAMREYLGEDKLLRSRNFVEVCKAGIVSIGKGAAGLFKRNKGEDQDQDQNKD